MVILNTYEKFFYRRNKFVDYLNCHRRWFSVFNAENFINGPFIHVEWINTQLICTTSLSTYTHCRGASQPSRQNSYSAAPQMNTSTTTINNYQTTSGDKTVRSVIWKVA